VASRTKDGQTAVVKVFRWGLRTKAELVEKLRKVSRAQVVEVYSQGTLSDGRHFEVLEHIRHGTLADLGKGGMAPQQVKEVLNELTDAVSALHEVGIIHRDLKPSNVLVRTVKPLDLVLTDFGISSLAELSLHATSAHRTVAYSAPEAMTGVVSWASDWWSVGVMVLELLRGAHPFAGLDERAINFQLVSRGIEIPENLPVDWSMLLKGLLTREQPKRWGVKQLRGWLAGKRDQRVHYTPAAASVIGQKPYRFQQREYGDAASLAVALAEKWEEGIKHWGRGYVLQWVENQLEDQDLAIQLHDVQDDQDLGTTELQLAAAVLVMNRALPLSYKGELVKDEWLGSNWEAERQVLESSLPRWLESLTGNSKLQKALERWKTGIRFIERSEVKFNDDAAERLLAAGNLTTVDELVAEQRSNYVRGRRPILTELLKKTPLDFNEAVLLASATDKEFYTAQQLREEEATQRLHEGSEFLRQSNVAVNTETAKRLLASGDRAAVDLLVAERRSKYRKGRLEVLTQLLRKEPLDFNEAALLASATDEQFYTAQESLAEELVGWMDEQGVNYNKKVARLLILGSDQAEVIGRAEERRRQLARGRTPAAELMLRQERLEHRQAVLLLAAQDGEFVTLEEKLVEDSLTWLDKQGVNYNRKDAIELIVAKSWEVLTPRWEARRQRAWLAKSPVIEKALTSTQPEYLAAVLGATAEENAFWADELAKGEAYSKGDGVWQDLDEAQRWFSIAVASYRAAAAQGDARAQCNLGVCYKDGRGVMQDQAQAIHWYRLAAEQGHAAAQFNLGACYHHGAGIAQNLGQAVGWYRLAAEQDYPHAQFQLADCYAQGVGVLQDKTEAVGCYSLAAKQGHADAQFNLALCYDRGDGVPQNKAHAVRWYRLAAEQGHALAQFNLGVCYDEGERIEQDKFQAVHWFRLAAAHGHPAAQYSLGRCYQLGVGVEQDPLQAVGWYRLAAEQCYANAEFQLAECYANGIVVPEHQGEAVCWYRRAAKQGHAAAQTALNKMLGYVSNEPPVISDAASEEQLGHHLTPSGTCCSVCGCTREAIRHFGWRCWQTESQ
jgi:TPR repeat protein/serine/threonine protein kinase